MNQNEWFIIDDLKAFVESSRILIFDNFGQTEKKNLDDLSLFLTDLSTDEINEINRVLSQSECMLIAKEFLKVEKNKKTKDVRYIISTKQYMSMLESFNSRLTSNLLNDLVSKGIFETAYDSESNDFIFWVKENDNAKKKTNKENPETD